MSQASLFDPPAAARAPETPRQPGKLRWYQEEAEARILKSWASNRSTLLVMATGLGKTKLFTHVAKRWPYEGADAPGVLVLAHRDELVRQAATELHRTTGEPVGIEKADERSSRGHRLVVGSVQSMNQARLDRLGKDRFGLVIADEAHHFLSPTYRRAFEFFDAKLLGVTATPDRADEKALGQIFEDVAFVYDIEDGIADGFLVPLSGTSVQLDEIDLSGVTETAGDLTAGQLDEAMYKAVNGIVQRSRELEPDRLAIYFWPGVRCAEAAAARANALRPGTAAWVAGETHPDERAESIRRFRAGELRELHNCMVLTEGFDAPDTSMIVMGRPTKSRSLLVQCVGRGLRSRTGTIDHLPGRDDGDDRRRAIAISAKPNCVVLDFVGNAGKHSLVGPADVLGGNHTEAEVAEAKRQLKKQGGDVREALAAARDKLARAAAAARVKVSSREQAWNPFAVLNLDPEDGQEYVRRFGFKPPSEKQLEALQKYGFPASDLKGISRAQAGKMMDAIVRRSQDGLASYKQLNQLRNYGVTDMGVKKQNASAAMQYLSDRGWGKRGKIDPQALISLIYPSGGSNG